MKKQIGYKEVSNAQELLHFLYDCGTVATLDTIYVTHRARINGDDEKVAVGLWEEELTDRSKVYELNIG